jgi:hypothetical protein
VEAQIRHYDRILLINLEGVVTEQELAQLSGVVNTVASRISSVVCDVHRANVAPGPAAALLKLKKSYERSKVKFLIVSTVLAGADHRTLADAVDALKTQESSRVLEIFAQEAALIEARAKVDRFRTDILNRIGAPAGTTVTLDAAIRGLEERHARLRTLFKALSSEVLHLQGESEVRMPEPTDPGAIKAAETKRRALDAIAASGAVD